MSWRSVCKLPVVKLFIYYFFQTVLSAMGSGSSKSQAKKKVCIPGRSWVDRDFA